jgi:hypothetical protein
LGYIYINLNFFPQPEEITGQDVAPEEEPLPSTSSEQPISSPAKVEATTSATNIEPSSSSTPAEPSTSTSNSPAVKVELSTSSETTVKDEPSASIIVKGIKVDLKEVEQTTPNVETESNVDLEEMSTFDQNIHFAWANLLGLKLIKLKPRKAERLKLKIDALFYEEWCNPD